MNKEIIQQEKISYIAIGYELIGVSYSNADRICKVKLNLIADDEQKYDYPELTLWEDDEYDAAGQWTDSDVDNRILELLNN
jgi:hypothetical protein